MPHGTLQVIHDLPVSLQDRRGLFHGAGVLKCLVKLFCLSVAGHEKTVGVSRCLPLIHHKRNFIFQIVEFRGRGKRFLHMFQKGFIEMNIVDFLDPPRQNGFIAVIDLHGAADRDDAKAGWNAPHGLLPCRIRCCGIGQEHNSRIGGNGTGDQKTNKPLFLILRKLLAML